MKAKTVFTVFFVFSIICVSSVFGEIIQYDSHDDNHKKTAAKEINKKPFVLCSECPQIQRLSSTRLNFPLAIRVTEATRDVPDPSQISRMPVPSQAPCKPFHDVAKVTVFFDFDSSFLKEGEKRKMDKIPEGLHVDVTGYTCDHGTKGYNDDLALKRAESVSSYLEQRKVIPVKTSGKGKCCYVSDKKRLNRRVEVTPAG